jgi:esterase/lipase superfamily enzyme
VIRTPRARVRRNAAPGGGRHNGAMRHLTTALLVVLAALAAACTPKNTVMRAPALFAAGDTDPFTEAPQRERSPTMEIFYATDRARKTDFVESVQDYGAERGIDLRLGVASVGFGRGPETWDDIAGESVSRQRRQTIPMRVAGAEEFGYLNSTVMFWDPKFGDEDNELDQDRWVELFNARLAETPGRDVFVFVCPFKISFEEGLFITAQFHHFTGRRGVPLCYSWPTYLGTLDYLKAAETAYASAFNLRRLLQDLAEYTDVRKIHLMSYSAGARTLAYALHGLRLLGGDEDADEDAIRRRSKIGQVVFAGPDIDADSFGQMYIDGIADVADQLTIYSTPKDKALGMSKFLFGYKRLGALAGGDFTEHALDYLAEQEQTSFVTVTDAEGAMEDNAHGYFRKSPWVSSDIVMILRHELPPGGRGLVRDADTPALWTFPPDYRERAEALARELYPAR